MGETLITCPACGRLTAAETRRCQSCDADLHVDLPVRTPQREEERSQRGCAGCLGPLALVVLAGILALFSWLTTSDPLHGLGCAMGGGCVTGAPQVHPVAGAVLAGLAASCFLLALVIPVATSGRGPAAAMIGIPLAGIIVGVGVYLGPAQKANESSTGLSFGESMACGQISDRVFVAGALAMMDEPEIRATLADWRRDFVDPDHETWCEYWRWDRKGAELAAAEPIRAGRVDLALCTDQHALVVGVLNLEKEAIERWHHDRSDFGIEDWTDWMAEFVVETSWDHLIAAVRDHLTPEDRGDVCRALLAERSTETTVPP